MVPGERVGYQVRGLRKVLAGRGVLGQADGHADRCEAEPEVEAEGIPEQAGEDGAREAADVDAHVEDGEAGVAAFILFVVQASHQGCGVGLQAAGADGDQYQADCQPGVTGNQGQGDVANHHEDGGVEEGPFGSQDAVRYPGADDRGEVDAAAVGANEACCHSL